MRLKNKVAIVTGASNGIGLAISERYLAEGVKLVMTDIDAEKGAAEDFITGLTFGLAGMMVGP